jgi:predicted secreted protein
LLQGEGHITGFRPAGRVDLATALFPFRANQNTAVLVVNGDPPVVDADDPAFLARGWEPARMGGTQIPPAWLFPGDRFPLEALAVETTPYAGQRLALSYELRTCRACPTLTTVWYGLAFDAAGRFLGFGFARAANEEAALGDDRATARVAAGGVVLIRLPANRTTGYLWMLDPLPADGPLRLLWHAYRISAPTRPGAPGEDLWWLEALQPGTVTVTLRHLRPWQPDPNAPTRQFVIEVTAP